MHRMTISYLTARARDSSALRRSFRESKARVIMQDDQFITDDPGTILESFVSPPRPVSKWSPPPAAPIPAARPVPSPAAPAFAADEVLYRSQYRWTAPRILICDDGSLDEGEVFYVRSESVVVGRVKGDIVIGHDSAMSASHAEIIRKDAGGKHAWILRDLGSSNGTFARVRNVTLKPGLMIQLGSKRYRFELPGSPTLPGAAAVSQAGTALLTDLRGATADVLPALVESTSAGSPPHMRHPFRNARVSIGRSGFGNDVEIDDLCLAKTHAVVTRDVSGAWQLEAQPSLNGVWVRVDTIRLMDHCHFQCGEQRFRFRL